MISAMSLPQVLELILVAVGALAHAHAGSARSRNASSVWFNPPLFGWTLSWSTWFAVTFITLNLETLDIGRVPFLSMCLDIMKGALINIQAGLLLHGVAQWRAPTRKIPPLLWYLVPTGFVVTGFGPVLAGPMNSFLRNIDGLVLAFLLSDAFQSSIAAILLHRARRDQSNLGRRISRSLENSLWWSVALLGAAFLGKLHQGGYQAGKYHWVLLFDLAHIVPPVAILFAAYRAGTVALEVTRASLLRALIFFVPFAFYVAHKQIFPGSPLDRLATYLMAGIGFAMLLGPLPRIAFRNASRTFNLRQEKQSEALEALETRLRRGDLPADLPSFVARCLGRILSCRSAVEPASREGVASILRAAAPGRISTFRRATSREEALAWEDLGARILLPLRTFELADRECPIDTVILLGPSRKAHRMSPEIQTRLWSVLATLQSAIDARRDLRKELESERRLQEGERLAMLGLLSASAAHEIKNPLSSIKNIAHAAGKEVPKGSVLAMDLEMIASEVDRLDATVRRMLHFARDRQACDDAVATLRAVCGLLDQEAHSRGIRIVISAPADPLPFPMSENDLKAVLFNLVLNALQHTPRGENVRIGLEEAGPLLSVTNPGEIPEEFRPRLFTPLASRGGTGLGLYICRKRAEEAGGRLVHVALPGSTQFRLSWGTE
ncbi:MAG: HAMP domain-containing histidine kinase [Fibrobacteria bacterium]|nr:HAMP domain-containing histidine kinase [Fibrobacteria bacterium]